MIKIRVSQAAFKAMGETLPFDSVAVEPEPAQDGSVGVWLPRDVIARLQAMRRPGRLFFRCDLGAGRTLAYSTARKKMRRIASRMKRWTSISAKTHKRDSAGTSPGARC